MYWVGFGATGLGILIALASTGNPTAQITGVVIACAGLMITGFKYYFL